MKVTQNAELSRVLFLNSESRKNDPPSRLILLREKRKRSSEKLPPKYQDLGIGSNFINYFYHFPFMGKLESRNGMVQIFFSRLGTRIQLPTSSLRIYPLKQNEELFGGSWSHQTGSSFHRRQA